MVKKTSEMEQRTDSVKYTGVRKRKWGKWVSEIRLPNSRERIWLGSYDTPEKAALAFDAASFCLRGNTAKFNFPDNPPDITGGRSMTPSEIQVAAAQFANSEINRSQRSSQVSDVSGSGLRTEFSSPSISDATIFDGDLSYDGSMDLLTSMSSGNYPMDYGLFPGFDDYSDDFFAPGIGGVDHYEEQEIVDEYLNEGSFLWNF